MTFRWVPLIVRRGPEIEARTRVEALEIAMARHGADLVRVQSVASYEISEEELAAAEEQRRREDDGA